MSAKIFCKRESDSVYTSINHHKEWEWRRSLRPLLAHKATAVPTFSGGAVGGAGALEPGWEELKSWGRQELDKKKRGKEVEMGNALEDAPSRSTTTWTGEKTVPEGCSEGQESCPLHTFPAFQHPWAPATCLGRMSLRSAFPSADPSGTSSAARFLWQKKSEITGCSSLATCPCLRICHQLSYCPL